VTKILLMLSTSDMSIMWRFSRTTRIWFESSDWRSSKKRNPSWILIRTVRKACFHHQEAFNESRVQMRRSSIDSSKSCWRMNRSSSIMLISSFRRLDIMMKSVSFNVNITLRNWRRRMTFIWTMQGSLINSRSKRSRRNSRNMRRNLMRNLKTLQSKKKIINAVLKFSEQNQSNELKMNLYEKIADRRTESLHLNRPGFQNEHRGLLRWITIR